MFVFWLTSWTTKSCPVFLRFLLRLYLSFLLFEGFLLNSTWLLDYFSLQLVSFLFELFPCMRIRVFFLGPLHGFYLQKLSPLFIFLSLRPYPHFLFCCFFLSEKEDNVECLLNVERSKEVRVLGFPIPLILLDLSGTFFLQ